MKNDKYFKISLKSQNGLLSIHESRKLKPSEYHKIKSEEKGNYQILIETIRTTGKRFYAYDVFEEPYTTYEFRDISFPIINDFNLDGFIYDEKNKVVMYGLIYGIYAVKNGKNFQDVISGREIPVSIIDRYVEVKTKEDFQGMIEDLEIIKKHKKVYLKIMRERTARLVEGAINQKKAAKKYLESYNRMEQELHEKVQQNLEESKRIDEQQKDEIKEQKEKVKKMISKIKDSN